MIVDDGKDLVDVSITLVKGWKENVDGSVTFKMFGGPYHNQKLRVYKPFSRVVWNLEGNVVVYKIHPPVRKGGKWVYIYDPDDHGDITEAERGDPIDPEASQRWQNYLNWKRQEELKKAQLVATWDPNEIPPEEEE